MVNKTSTESTGLLGGTQVGNGTFPSEAPSSSSSAPEISAQQGIGMFNRAVNSMTNRFMNGSFKNRGVRRIEEKPALQKYRANKVLNYIRTEASAVQKLSLAIMDEEITNSEFASLIKDGYLVVPDNLNSVLNNLINMSSSLNFNRINFAFPKTKGNFNEKILLHTLTKVLKDQTGNGQIIADIMDQFSPDVSLVVAAKCFSLLGIAEALRRDPDITSCPEVPSHLNNFSASPVFTYLLSELFLSEEKSSIDILKLFISKFEQKGLEEKMMGLIYDIVLTQFDKYVNNIRGVFASNTDYRSYLKLIGALDVRLTSCLYIIKCIQDIQELGIDLNKGDEEGNTLIHRLMGNKNHEEIVKKLLELDFDVNIQNKKGDTLLHLAIQGRRNSVIKLLLNKQGINLKSKNTDGFTPLHAAAKSGNLLAIELLRNAQVETSPQTSQGNTPLHLAAFSRHTDAIQKLHQMDPDSIESANKSGNTPLMFVIGSENLSILEPISNLLELGANVNAQNFDLMTPLHLSAVRTSLSKELIEALTQKGAQVNSRDQDGNTPLLLAAKSNNLEAVEALLSTKGVNLLIKDSNDQNFLEGLFSGEGIKQNDLGKVITKVKQIATPAQIIELNTENLQTLMEVHNLKLA